MSKYEGELLETLWSVVRAWDQDEAYQYASLHLTDAIEDARSLLDETYDKESNDDDDDE